MVLEIHEELWPTGSDTCSPWCSECSDAAGQPDLAHRVTLPDAALTKRIRLRLGKTLPAFRGALECIEMLKRYDFPICSRSSPNLLQGGGGKGRGTENTAAPPEAVLIWRCMASASEARKLDLNHLTYSHIERTPPLWNEYSHGSLHLTRTSG